MTYGSNDKPDLTLAEAIRKRPGMYLGGVSTLGAARLIDEAVNVLIALVVNRRAELTFHHHAFLDVSLRDSDATVLIDYHPNECPDISARCAALEENRDKIRPDKYALEQGLHSLAPMTIVSALASDLCIFRSTGGDVKSVLEIGQIDVPRQANSVKGAFVGARFRVRKMIKTSELTNDYLEGFLEGSKRIPGLIVRNIEIEQRS